MTVKELIQTLQGLDPDLRVMHGYPLLSEWVEPVEGANICTLKDGESVVVFHPNEKRPESYEVA